MSRPLVVSVFGGLVLVMWLAAWTVVRSAERSPLLLTGELWQEMSPDAKHPDQLKRPVVDAIFNAVVMPERRRVEVAAP